MLLFGLVGALFIASFVGSADAMLIDNETRAVTKLQSDGDGGGGVPMSKWDLEERKLHIRTITYDGDIRESKPFGQ